MQSTVEEKNKILFINFNQDLTCFFTGTENGFSIYDIKTCENICTRSNYI